MPTLTPDISIIVPILNEADQLPELLASLARQCGVTLELIICDGGSQDGSAEVIDGLSETVPFAVLFLKTGRGRGHQMNAGAAAAAADLLLFLHADSRFTICSALKSAVKLYRSQTAEGSARFAARFGLQFRRSDASPSLPFFFYEAKARLPRAECIRGDQGFLLNRVTLAESGGFDESLLFLEDLRLALDLGRRTEWQLVPALLSTSARRFESEGLLERQILNAIIVNNALAGWTQFFQELPDLYVRHDAGGRLQLRPILAGISRMIDDSSTEWRRSFWLTTGRHVAGNIWQLFFWLDVRRAFRAGTEPGEVRPDWLLFYERRLTLLFESRAAAWLAHVLVRLWLRRMLTKTS
ncbi:MAG TPA: glycosyltransferase [Desulfuromonadales bacterium]|nr:glycosyltransferase [Desulfuromonadales bacterium]